MGEYFLNQLHELSGSFSSVTNPRGRGLMCAWDMPNPELRDKVINKSYDSGLFLLKCGEKSVRIRPALNIDRAEIEEGFSVVRKVLSSI